MAVAPNQELPALYRKPEILDANRHPNLKFMRPENYRFARNLNSVPILLGELTKVIADYPIAFTPGANPMLIAILGARTDENLFVDAAGKWQEGAYVPAYVRRYPFILAKTDTDRLVLSADMDADTWKDDGDPVFVGGKPTSVAHRAYQFCHEYHLDFEKTRQFAKAVYDQGLLKSKRSSISTPSGAKLNLVGFSAVDWESVDGLDNRSANSFRKNGWLGPLYLHAASIERLKSFPVKLDTRRPPA